MGFSSSRVYFYDSRLIPAAADEVAAILESEGYLVKKENLLTGDVDISLSKGGIFKAVLGMKTALKISVRKENGNIRIEAKVGIFGQQIIPTVISMLYFWPILLTQVWGLIKQSKLDDHVLELFEKAFEKKKYEFQNNASEKIFFCSECGSPVTGKYCSACGSKQD